MAQNCPLDRVIRGTFEWREVANILGAFGVHQPEWRLANRHARVVGESTYRTADVMAHRDPAFVAHLCRLLGRMHAREVLRVRQLSLDDLEQSVCHDYREDETGWLWAMLSDERAPVVQLAKLWVRESVG
jgi:hypothetical protein